MNFGIELVRYSHTVGESCLHLQFTPAYRKPLFADKRVKKLVELYLLAKADELEIVIAGLGFGPNHLHVFICNWKNYSISKLVKRLKGFVSRMMRKNHWKLFKHLLWGKKFWSEGYFHRTVGSVTKDAMEFYVSHSQDKHWEAVDYDVYKYQKQLTLSQFTLNAPHFSAG